MKGSQPDATSASVTPSERLAAIKAQADELVGRVASYGRATIEHGPLPEQATHGLPLAIGRLEQLLADAEVLADEQAEW